MATETEAEKWDRLLGKHHTYIGSNQSYHPHPFCRCGWNGRTYSRGQGAEAQAEADAHMASVSSNR